MAEQRSEILGHSIGNLNAPQEVTGPAWKDLPDAPGMWICHENGQPFDWSEAMWIVDLGELYDKFGNPVSDGPPSRWFGPIPEDTHA
jgi:hypothetical protein